jgi:hypothetical protein
MLKKLGREEAGGMHNDPDRDFNRGTLYWTGATIFMWNFTAVVLLVFM